MHRRPPRQPRPRIGPQDPAIGTVLTWESITQAEHLHGPLLTRMPAREPAAT
ncbi:MAG: hypothetical protein JWM19_7281 [Actinomycetia bacterium]|nr:hypothetical protein [Actinomycetes bacterium]